MLRSTLAVLVLLGVSGCTVLLGLDELPADGACIVDNDGDAACDDVDNCPGLSNRNQEDADDDDLGDACDPCVDDPDNDADSDTLCIPFDNCPAISNQNQLDRDSDLAGDLCDLDDDADGQVDALDPAPLDPNLCGDSDADSCDDCAVGSDGFGPMSDMLPATDGPDTDMDGQCNAGDLDDDNDGRLDASDISLSDPDVCGDIDGDTCDDCAVGTDNFGPLSDSLPTADGLDTDSDGACNAGDTDDDNDGVVDVLDISARDPLICGDSDTDTCDDCAVGVDGFGPVADNNPSADGADTDVDGSCNVGDFDDDNDGVADAGDPNPLDPDRCGDSDTDTCDDCVVGTDDFGALPDNLPANDGVDTDSDGACNAGDPDDDNDMRNDPADLCPAGVTGWISDPVTDVDQDGCRDAGEDCNTCASTCGSTCVNTDADGLPDCLEQFCGSDPNLTASTCVLVGSQAQLSSAITTANGSVVTRDFILLNTSFTVASSVGAITGNNAVAFTQCSGTTVTVDDGLPLVDNNLTLFSVSGNGNVFDGLRLANVDDGHVMFALSGATNTVRHSTVENFERNAVFVTGSDSTIYNNVFRGGTLPAASASAGAIMISGNGADRTRVIGNVIVQNTMDGIRIADGDDTLIDHNTIAVNIGDGIAIDGTFTTNNLCVRNNIISSNGGFAIDVGASAVISWTAACELSLAGGLYGNDQFGNNGVCGGAGCANCSCLNPAPIGGAASFFEYNLSPAFTSTSFGDPDFFCIAEAMLIDSMDSVDGDLVTAGTQPHDLNGREPGLFVSIAPDGGGREAGAEGCP